LRKRYTSEDAIEAAASAGVSSDAAVKTAISDPASQSGSYLNATYGRKDTAPRSLADFGVLPGNTAAQNRAGFTAAAASGFRDFTLPPGTYQWSATAEGQWMMTFAGAKRIRVRGLNAVINDTTTYTNNGALTGLFLLDNCKDVEISGIEYVGPVLDSPGTLLGYQGATLVSAINGTDGVKVDIRASNCRYGVSSGNYAVASQGQCKNFDINLRGSMVGYTTALYYADGVHLDIDVDGVHRAMYLAGVNSARGVVRYRNQYIAPIAALLTDCLIAGTDSAAQANPSTAPTSSRGCSNIDIDVIETGSSVWVADSYVAGISLSRVDPCAFRNIKVRVSTTATDTTSTTIHGWIINSTANAVWSRYTYNWESTVLLENIKIGGLVDKAATTVAVASGSNGPLTIRTDDTGTPTHMATIRNLTVEDLLVRVGSQSYIARIYVRGLATPMVVDRLVGPNAAGTSALYVVVAGSTTQPVIFNGSLFATLDLSVVPTALVTLGQGTAISAPDADRTVALRGGTLRGAGPRQVSKIITTPALSGASVTLTGAIPAGVKVDSVQGRITTAIAGASGFQLGVTGDLTRYADLSVTGSGNLVQPSNHAASAITSAVYASATDLIVTAKTANFTAGVIRLVVNYWEYPGLAT